MTKEREALIRKYWAFHRSTPLALDSLRDRGSFRAPVIDRTTLSAPMLSPDAPALVPTLDVLEFRMEQPSTDPGRWVSCEGVVVERYP